MGSLMATGTRYGARTAWPVGDAANLPVGVAVLAGMLNQVVIQSFCTIAGIWLNVERERPSPEKGLVGTVPQVEAGPVGGSPGRSKRSSNDCSLAQWRQLSRL